MGGERRRHLIPALPAPLPWLLTVDINVSQAPWGHRAPEAWLWWLAVSSALSWYLEPDLVQLRSSEASWPWTQALAQLCRWLERPITQEIVCGDQGIVTSLESLDSLIHSWSLLQLTRNWMITDPRVTESCHPSHCLDWTEHKWCA